ncbi:MAG: hypothetical protein ACD_49C00079G0021 [uncultured bacterium (gcode 4)]|uniref:Uncharacterized protein n=1 Tax=uncultured bacterium (gcode 4) TaxID=1234023 RepID=K2AVF2_9BACT|nr:MAG: hypothetical protein ACD_49C00079G0021 [uncultured bacterium (gcode 4)]
MDLNRISIYLTWRFPPFYQEAFDKYELIELIRANSPKSISDDFFKFIDSQDFYSMSLNAVKRHDEKSLKKIIEILNIPEDAGWLWNDRLTNLSKNIIKPLILTEWKSDEKILKTAWLKINWLDDFNEDNLNEVYDNNSLFKIENCDLYNWEKLPKTLANAENLWNIIYYWKWESQVIWLFDRDDAWFKGYHKIDIRRADFEEIKDEDQNHLKVKTKLWKNYATWLVYPIPLNRPWYGKRDNKKSDWSIEIEYYISDKDIEKIWFKDSIKPMSDDWFNYTKLEIKQKESFSKKIVESHNEINFSDFKILFDKINEIL